MTNPKSLPAARPARTKEDLAGLMRPVSERLDPQQEAENAALVAFELEVVSEKTGRFGWAEMDAKMKQRLSDDWTEVLRKYTLAEVRRGIGDCLSAAPTKCPNERAVQNAILARRAKAMVQAPKEPLPAPEAKERVTAERAAEIMAQAGFAGVSVRKMPQGKDE